MQSNATAMKYGDEAVINVFDSLSLFEQSELQKDPIKSYKSNLCMDLQYIAQDKPFSSGGVYKLLSQKVSHPRTDLEYYKVHKRKN